MQLLELPDAGDRPGAEHTEDRVRAIGVAREEAPQCGGQSLLLEGDLVPVEPLEGFGDGRAVPQRHCALTLSEGRGTERLWLPEDVLDSRVPVARVAPAVVDLNHTGTEEGRGQEHHDLQIPPVAEPGEVRFELLPRRLLPEVLPAADEGKDLL